MNIFHDPFLIMLITLCAVKIKIDLLLNVTVFFFKSWIPDVKAVRFFKPN